MLDSWIEFDDKDLLAHVERANLLRRIPGREPDGVNAIEALYDKAPNVFLISYEYVNLLLERGEYSRAALAAFSCARYSESLVRSMNWWIYWDTGRGFNGKQRMLVSPEWGQSGLLELSSILPAGNYERLRIDLPPASNLKMKIEDASVTLEDGSNQSLLYLKKSSVWYNDIISSGESAFVVKGHEPFIYFNVPNTVGTNKKIKMMFRAQMSVARFDRLEKLLIDPKAADQIVRELNALNEEKAAAFIMSLR